MDALSAFRKEIDHIDNEIIKLLSKRIKIVKEIKEYKKENSLMYFDKKRYTEMLSARAEEGVKSELRERFVRDLFNVVHEESLSLQLEE